MTPRAHTFHPAPARTARPRRGKSLWSRLLTWHAIWSERRRLARLEAHRLNDLGLSIDDARAEARRKSWDAPERWRR